MPPSPALHPLHTHTDPPLTHIPALHTHTLPPSLPPSMSLPALPLGLKVGVLEGVMAADTEGCLGELRAGNLVPHVVCTKIWLLPRSPESRGGAGEALGEVRMLPNLPRPCCSCHQHTAGHWQGTGGAATPSPGQKPAGTSAPKGWGTTRVPASCGQVKHCPNRAPGPCSRRWPEKWLQLPCP